MSVEFALWMFPALMLFIFLGFPVAFSLLSVAFIFGAMRFDFSIGVVNVFAQTVDEIASAAELVMGKADGVPVAIVRGVDPLWFGNGGVVADVVRDPADDLFR